MGEKTIFFFPSWLPSLFIFHLILEMAKYWLTDRETRDIDTPLQMFAVLEYH